ncbi:hypothetical protein N6H18_03225 [Reichenbachiella agarivorans]|uniref:MetA-pathway of phenol degradation n=1 Tax=Reichenbachiella agarivorans TaxID=2979464 RepID=A0ABY6CR20_9BACT|nr:DUF6588 family protein [Reichenbachiella agarivorans]UXP32966.1 hypothetical protein N6H18_03225 [Reichenbachiella agarivorans]
MKLKFTNKVGGVLIALILGTSVTQAQDLADMTEFLKAGSEDASVFMGDYLNPMFTGLGYGAANGWYNTAKAHKPLGFDLTVTLNVAKAPSSDLFFNINEDDYDNVELVDPSKPKTSTLFGDETTTEVTAEYTHSETGTTVTSTFTTPEGLQASGLDKKYAGYVPMPMVQLGIGLIKNTDLKVRWMPTIKGEDDYGNESKVSLFGLGLMHDFKQWIPAIKHIPIDMAVLVGYNRINTSSGLDTNGDVMEGENQRGEFAINSWTYQLLVSKKLSVLTIYGGFGYNNTSTNLKILGTYDISDENSPLPVILTDPVDETYLSSGWRGTAGLRLQLAVITIHADYTFQEYNTLTAGIGFTLR